MNLKEVCDKLYKRTLVNQWFCNKPFPSYAVWETFYHLNPRLRKRMDAHKEWIKSELGASRDKDL